MSNELSRLERFPSWQCEGTLAPFYSAWYFWIALLVVICVVVALIVICVMCCRKPRKVAMIRCWQPVPNAVLKTAQDPQGIIQPDVIFYKKPAGGTVTVVVPGTPSLRLTTPMRPLTPAYEPTQPVTIRTTRAVATTSNELTLPPGYIPNQDPKYQ
ncbi:uncharacterized protein LOC111640573 [Centruroides sculpturatus]|uniref:uncharacterized protein LOC111640573 n=1 Tax=Centruroides sculpturatus TaxID=218467 RepID=UPI000C6E7FE3|nr:uncharacterized protein LOC111640573 [Centruroides sculpturatus]